MSHRHPTLQVLDAPGVRAFSGGRFFGAMGNIMLTTTIAWHVADVAGRSGDLKDKALYLGVLGLLEFLPVIPCTLLAGALADTHERRDLVIGTRILSLLLALALWAIAGRVVPELFTVLALAFGLSVVRSFQRPAAAAILPNLVRPGIFQNAVAVNSTIRNLAWASGPVCAGVALQFGGVRAAYLSTLCILIVSLIFWAFVPRIGIALTGSRADLSLIREGIDFVFHRPVILSCMVLDMFAVILAGPRALLPIFASDILGVGSLGYGVLSAAIAAGTFLMASLLLFRPPFLRPGRMLLIAVACFGGSAVAFGLSGGIALSVAALVVAGMADQVSMLTRATIIQLSTPDALRGRVNAVNLVFIGASNEFGDAFSGFLAAITTPIFAVVAGGIGCLGLSGGVAATVPSLRQHRAGDGA